MRVWTKDEWATWQESMDIFRANERETQLEESTIAKGYAARRKLKRDGRMKEVTEVAKNSVRYI